LALRNIGSGDPAYVAKCFKDNNKRNLQHQVLLMGAKSRSNQAKLYNLFGLS